jgi:hypothetical protein
LSKAIRYSVRNCDGEHLFTIDDSREAEAYEKRAKLNKVKRIQITKKGRTAIIFQLLPPELPSVEPSTSKGTACDLTANDSRGLAGLLGDPNIFQLERWAGYGLLREAQATA